MMIITDLNNQTEMIVDVNNISIKRKLGGEQTLQFTALNTDRNKLGYNLVQDESIVEGNNESFVIKNINEGPYTKNVVAINSFFENIDNFVLESFPDGLYTIQESLQLAFSNSDWSYVIQDNYPQRAKLEEFGNDNTVSMLNKIVNAFNSEYEIDNVNKRVIIVRRVGVDTDYQIRYKNNIQNIQREINSNDVKTQVQVFYNYDEFGNYNSSITYRSPNFDKYPRAKVREPIYSDIIVTEEQAIATARLLLKDTPDITISVDFLALRQLGYESNEVKLGNGVYLIDERLNIDSLARITEIEEFYKVERGQLVKDDSRPDIVTISNIRKNIVNNIVDQQQQTASIERTAVKQRALYNGCTITKEEGFKTVASNGVEAFLNATEGIVIRRDNKNKFYASAIDDELVLDGKLQITADNQKVLEAFKDTAGGIMRIYDQDELLNVEIGSNKYDTTNTGGFLILYNDGDDLTDGRLELFINRTNDAGVIYLKNTSNAQLIELEAINSFTNNPRMRIRDVNFDNVTTINPANVNVSTQEKNTDIRADEINIDGTPVKSNIEDLWREIQRLDNRINNL